MHFLQRACTKIKFSTGLMIGLPAAIFRLKTKSMRAKVRVKQSVFEH